jgi:uncharacterized LabA/DUF88 family protein
VPSEVALFVDLENITTSLWKTYAEEPDPLQWVQKALKYGPLSFARAYGDFSQSQLNRLEPRLRVAGIDPFNCPVKVRDAGSQSTVDINIAVDLFEVAMDRPTTETFVLMAGDSDYIRIVTRLRNRLGKHVVIAGVPGSVSRDLVSAAGTADPLEPELLEFDEEAEEAIIRLIYRYETSRREGAFPTFRFMSEYLRHPTNIDVIRPTMVGGKLTEFVNRGVLVQETISLPNGDPLRTTRLDLDHPLVLSALGQPVES